MTGTDTAPPIATAGELLSHAYQMELEAQERYDFLSVQMTVHNNSELADLFRELSRIEGLHAREILEQMKGREVPQIAPLDFKWNGGESPEALDLGDMHYMMTPREALLLALNAEQNAFEFFDHLLKATSDPEVKTFAAEFAEEEKEHVELVLKELKKYPEADEPLRDDMDPPVAQE